MVPFGAVEGAGGSLMIPMVAVGVGVVCVEIVANDSFRSTLIFDQIKLTSLKHRHNKAHQTLMMMMTMMMVVVESGGDDYDDNNNNNKRTKTTAKRRER